MPPAAFLPAGTLGKARIQGFGPAAVLPSPPLPGCRSSTHHWHFHAHCHLTARPAARNHGRVQQGGPDSRRLQQRPVTSQGEQRDSPGEARLSDAFTLLLASQPAPA